MSGLHADTGSINTRGRETVANSELFENEIGSLNNNVAELMTIWRGLSANEFKDSFLEQHENLEKFRELLNELGENISSAANILNRTEEDNASAGAHLFS